MPAGDGCQQGTGASRYWLLGSLRLFSPQVSTLVQTLRDPERWFLQPWRWLGSWVRQVWGAGMRTPARGSGRGGGSCLGRGCTMTLGAIGSHLPSATRADIGCLSLQVSSSRKVSAGVPSEPHTTCLAPGTTGPNLARPAFSSAPMGAQHLEEMALSQRVSSFVETQAVPKLWGMGMEPVGQQCCQCPPGHWWH